MTWLLILYIINTILAYATFQQLREHQGYLGGEDIGVVIMVSIVPVAFITAGGLYLIYNHRSGRYFEKGGEK